MHSSSGKRVDTYAVPGVGEMLSFSSSTTDTSSAFAHGETGGIRVPFRRDTQGAASQQFISTFHTPT
jgi:hypothetical protein